MILQREINRITSEILKDKVIEQMEHFPMIVFFEKPKKYFYRYKYTLKLPVLTIFKYDEWPDGFHIDYYWKTVLQLGKRKILNTQYKEQMAKYKNAIKGNAHFKGFEQIIK